MDHQQSSPLFHLPPELRNRIYVYALSQEETPEQPQHTAQEKFISLDTMHLHAPSNELLQTCHLIHAESRGIFVEAQRNFWKDNVLSVVLKDDWKDDEVDATNESGLWDLRKAQLNLIAKIVVVVESKESSCQYHFFEDPIREVGFTFDRQSSNGTVEELKAMGRLVAVDLIAYSKDIHQAVEKLTGTAKYFQSANKYLSIAVKGRESTTNAGHMVLRIQDTVYGLVADVDSLEKGRRTAYLKKVVQHCQSFHSVEPKPRQRMLSFWNDIC